MKSKICRSNIRRIELGNPDILALPLAVNKKTGCIENMQQLKNAIKEEDLEGLKELHRSLFTERTRLREKKLRLKLNKYLDDVEVGYMQNVGETSNDRPAPAAADVVNVAKQTEHELEGESYPRKYRGAEYELVRTVGGWRLEGPPGHPACNKLYSSPSRAARILTGGTTEVNGRAFFKMKAKRKIGKGRPASPPKLPKPIKVRDPRLPANGETIYKEHGGYLYKLDFDEGQIHLARRAEDNPKVDEVEHPFEYVSSHKSISGTATAITDCQENGFKFFNLAVSGVAPLDPWEALIAVTWVHIKKFDPEIDLGELIGYIEEGISDIKDLDIETEANALARAVYKERALNRIMAEAKRSDQRG